MGSTVEETEDSLLDLVSAAEPFVNSDGLDRYGRPTPKLSEYIPIAEGGDGDLYRIGIRGKSLGKVAFFHDFTHNSGDARHLGIVAPSLSKLFAMILAEALEWCRLARNGDHEALFAWLDEGGNVNSRDAARRESLLTTAMDMHDVEMVRGLLARGAKVNREAQEMAELLAGSEGRMIRNMIAKKK